MKTIVTEDDLMLDCKTLRLSSLDCEDGHIVLLHFLSIPNIVPFMINTKQKYCSSFIFYNTETFEIVKRIDLWENITHPYVSIWNIRNEWFFLQRDSTNMAAKGIPKSFRYTLLHINSKTKKADKIFVDHLPDKKAIISASQTKIYILFLQWFTIYWMD